MCLSALISFQPESTDSSLRGGSRPHHHHQQQQEEDDDGDLNKALGVQRFQQILNPTPIAPDEQHRACHQEDIDSE